MITWLWLDGAYTLWLDLTDSNQHLRRDVDSITLEKAAELTQSSIAMANMKQHDNRFTKVDTSKEASTFISLEKAAESLRLGSAAAITRKNAGRKCKSSF